MKRKITFIIIISVLMYISVFGNIVYAAETGSIIDYSAGDTHDYSDLDMDYATPAKNLYYKGELCRK